MNIYLSSGTGLWVYGTKELCAGFFLLGTKIDETNLPKTIEIKPGVKSDRVFGWVQYDKNNQVKFESAISAGIQTITYRSDSPYYFWIWIDPCYPSKKAYVDYPPPQAWAPAGYDYVYVQITNPQTGQTEIVPVDEPGYMTYTQAVNLPGAKIVSASSGTVTLPGTSWLSNLNLSDYKTWIGAAILGFVGYEIFRSLKKR
jgi:hypothetical protein